MGAGLGECAGPADFTDRGSEERKITGTCAAAATAARFLWKRLSMADTVTTMRFKWLWVVSAVLSAPLLQAQRPPDDTVTRAMQDELARSMSQLQLPQMEKPYFLAYRVQDITQRDISATLGSLTSRTGSPTRTRMIGVELRVGDYNLDNSNFISMRTFDPGEFGGLGEASLDANYAQIRREFWLATDREYKKALEDLSAKQAALKGRSGGDNVPDFSKEVPNTQPSLTSVPVLTDFDDLEAMARDLSAVFRLVPEIDGSSVTIRYTNRYTRYLNSEGTSFTRSEPLIKLEVSARTQAPDGQPIADSFDVYARSLADLPSRDALRARVQQMSALIVKLRSAASLDRYNGPVLFEGPAAAEIFLQRFGSGLAASRAPTSDNSQFQMAFGQMFDRMGGASFQDKLGARVLPSFLSVQDNATEAARNGVALLGTSAVDDDGVKTRETVLIDHGILKNLLSSRVPVSGILQSTGSRRGGGAAPSNLFVTSEKVLSSDELKRELLRRAKERGLDYALVVRRVGAGSGESLLEMARQMASQQNSSASVPEVFKVYSDGHEEPIRGVHISDMPVESFKEIVATGDSPEVYSDELVPRMGSMFSMASSFGGTLPVVSCVSPSLLFDEISLAKSQGPFPATPISPSPLAQQ
jgi:predicted Zn-dependent protease